ncbi:MAG: tRNA lysidine(34) synthetase TilS [Clostridia bacterium]|nr:tRNA lysidine(34) synthetase TilS [Clostridia bacterium]
MKNKCERAILQYNMLIPGDTVVVGVSGGADSMALLHYLHTCRTRYGIHVIAAHFNHGIRGEEADADERYVCAFCRENGIEYVVEKADIPLLAQQRKESIEECARFFRYEFLKSIDSKAKIATAHTNSDSCESFLFHFTRGTGLSGLCGIPPVRENVIRPVIFCSADDTRRYCRENGIDWREDSTNSDVKYTRNRIRLTTVPSLKCVNASFEENALRCMQILQTENDFLRLQTEKSLKECRMDAHSLNMDAVLELHPAIMRRVLLSFVRSVGCRDVSMQQVERLFNAGEGEVLTLNNSVRFQRMKGILSCLPTNAPTENISFPVTLQKECSYAFFDWYVRLSPVNTIENTNSCCAFFDGDKVMLPVLRNRRPADCLRNKKRKCTKSIKQLFSEARITREQRSRWPILADETGVIWIADFGVDESRLPDENTKNIIKIEWGKSL